MAIKHKGNRQGSKIVAGEKKAAGERAASAVSARATTRAGEAVRWRIVENGVHGSWPREAKTPPRATPRRQRPG
ncbi:MAG TPA: hypothetical protein PKD41_10875, partial [Solidesulfovibrio sp.]|nr:hypothetical protein [Solidesulfovibrio sp.]